MGSTNMLKTGLLLAALTVLMVLVGRTLGGNGGMVFAFVLALGMNFFSYWFSDKIALTMAGAKEVSESEAPELHAIVRKLAAQARIPQPRVCVIESDSPNAFATGRDPAHAAVAVTSGIVGILERTEPEAVLSHELGHIRNRDTLIMTVAATVAGAITMLAHMAQWALMFGGLAGRDDGERSGDADAAGARISSQSLALASALQRLEAVVQRRPLHVSETAAHLFIVNPLGGGGWVNLFRTHPTTEERVPRLRSMAAMAYS